MIIGNHFFISVTSAENYAKVNSFQQFYIRENFNGLESLTSLRSKKTHKQYLLYFASAQEMFSAS
jgi:hypothetical protein